MSAEEKLCPRCAETVKSAAIVCRFCGHEFATHEAPPQAPGSKAAATSGASEKRKGKHPIERAVGFGCLGLLVIAFIGVLVGGGSSTNDFAEADNVTAGLTLEDNATDEGKPEAPGSDWTATTAADELRGKPVHHASSTSENSVDFDFPYNGGSTLTMTVRRHPKWGDDVIFNISKGQFVCGIYECRGTINYGSGAEAISLSRPGDHSSDTLFATNGSSVIGKLKNAERVIVELPFYQEGNQQFTFKTKGLVWPPK